MEGVLLHHLLAGDHGAAVDQQADLERGPAHVGRDHVCVAGAGGQQRDAADPAGGARADQLDRARACVRDVGDAAVGLHHEQLAGESGLAQPVGEAVKVGDRRRTDVGIDHGGDGALVLTLTRRGL